MSYRSIRECPVSVLGGAGFLGSHLTDHLIDDRACDVLVVDNLVAGRREFIHPKAKFVHHDITGSEDHLRHLFERHKTRFVFSYFARPYVPDSYDRPLRTFDVNAMAALKAINAAQEAGVEAILQVSSAEVYGDAGSYVDADGEHYLDIRENCQVAPHSSYGASKAAIDAMVQVRWREAGTPCIALRQFNCLGERDVLHPYVVPAIVEQLAEQCDARCRRCNGDGLEPPGGNLACSVCGGSGGGPRPRGVVRLGNNSSRDFIYAGDAVRLAVELLEKGELGEVYNLGSEQSIRIFDLAKLIGKLMGFAEVVVEEDPARKRKWEIWNLTASCEKLYRAIGRKPEFTPLEEALRRTINWLVENEYRRG